MEMSSEIFQSDEIMVRYEALLWSFADTTQHHYQRLWVTGGANKDKSIFVALVIKPMKLILIRIRIRK